MKTITALILVLFISHAAEAGMIIGGETEYVVKKGDSLCLIGAKLGVDWKAVATTNHLEGTKSLKAGQRLKVTTRKIIPEAMGNGIIVNIPDRTLYYFENGKLAMAFPVALGLPSWNGMTNWRTPVGAFRVIEKVKNPTWHVPESIQWKMKMQGEKVKTTVPPGKENPLGRYAIKTSISGILIHETIKPASIYQFRSHGCVRVMPENMEKFFGRVRINTTGKLIYKPVKVAVSEKGRVFLEVHRDIYERLNDLRSEAKKAIDAGGAAQKVDWQKIDKALREKSGVAEDVTL